MGQVEEDTDEEDLLGYEETFDEEAVDDDAIRDAASSLLMEVTSKILVHYKDDSFLLFKYEKEGSNEDEGYTVMLEDPKLSNTPCNTLMSQIRSFLERHYNKLMFNSKEILLDIPVLDITINEDNIYNNQISFADIQTIFKILKERSENNHEMELPECLEATITLKPRFVSRYNALVELTESSATLSNIKPFSNNEDNPVILDDTASEVIVMELDENEHAKAKNTESKISNIDSESDDEILEIDVAGK
ncbi:hypothetical protein KAFR_0J02940 [Kazachstania africana CBS 2517]|uniref:Uncharacterized protein n=1 Tax=Kazachstania africana (strain ATCC 22294 / BCRC 22015 / CBS 2517 / CECT 1963 / NBRC 1671 / NRRL Y-8276) TaxID=1071382 RepID=H2B158_KAZAF|nr:hypothetical protein KAFR_0J02940 [Kazachstania africana CBS 2517]CCF60358.1 hypothetical protein KAFR_0J02940 [Kazachstania africana CBS 2517]